MQEPTYQLKTRSDICDQFKLLEKHPRGVSEESFQQNRNRILMKIEEEVTQQANRAQQTEKTCYITKCKIDFNNKQYTKEQKKRLEKQIKADLLEAGYHIAYFAEDGATNYRVQLYLYPFSKLERMLLTLINPDQIYGPFVIAAITMLITCLVTIMTYKQTTNLTILDSATCIILAFVGSIFLSAIALTIIGCIIEHIILLRYKR